MLVLAYLCLLIAGCLTFPDISQWGWKPTPVIVVGPIVWAGVCLLVQVRCYQCGEESEGKLMAVVVAV